MRIESYTINSLLSKDNLINVTDLFWKDHIELLESDESAVVIVRLAKGYNHFNTLNIMMVNSNNKLSFNNDIMNKAKPYYKKYVDKIEISYNVKTGLDIESFLVKYDISCLMIIRLTEYIMRY